MENKINIQNSQLTIQPKSLAEKRFNSPSVSNVKDQELLKFILDIISKTFLKCGQSVNAQELKLISTLFKDEMQMFPYITITELEKCFNDGYKEKYGKYYGLNVKTFVGWLDFYIQNVRNEELNKRKPQKVITKNISENKKEELILSGMQKCLTFYEKNKTILDGYIHFIYDVLNDDGFIDNSKELKIKFYNTAKLSIKTNIDNIVSKNKKEHERNKEILKCIEKEKSPTVISKAKELMVIKSLNEIYSNKEKLKTLKLKYKCI